VVSEYYKDKTKINNIEFDNEYYRLRWHSRFKLEIYVEYWNLRRKYL